MGDSGLIGIALLIVAAAIVGLWFLATHWKSITVYDYQRAVKYVDGAVAGEVKTGRHRYWQPRTDFAVVDTRPVLLGVAGQEVLTSDSVSLRVTVSATYRVVDVMKALPLLPEHYRWAYDAVQSALRDATSSATIEGLLTKRSTLAEAIQANAAPRLAEMGIELTQTSIKDVMFPGEFKKAFAQVVVARQEGLAALERARGETAALRHLANASKLFDENPALFRLRALEAVEKSGGTLVLGAGDGLGILPKA